MIAQPEDLSAHNFKPCDTHGGQAFRHWCMLMKHKGIFIGFDNHDWVVWASSNPEAEWYRGCQDSCAYGDPTPRNKDGTAKLLPISNLPAEAQPLAEKWVNEAIQIARTKIEAHELAEKRKKDEEEKRRREEYQAGTVDPWLKAVARND